MGPPWAMWSPDVSRKEVHALSATACPNEIQPPENDSPIVLQDGAKVIDARRCQPKISVVKERGYNAPREEMSCGFGPEAQKSHSARDNNRKRHQHSGNATGNDGCWFGRCHKRCRSAGMAGWTALASPPSWPHKCDFDTHQFTLPELSSPGEYSPPPHPRGEL